MNQQNEFKPKPYKRLTAFIPGYMQDRQTKLGVPKLHHYFDQYARFQSKHAPEPLHRVELFPWDSDWKDIANWVWRHFTTSPRIDIFAYSWGVGYGFTRLAKHLNKRSLKINRAILCDGVRYKYIPLLAQLMAHTPWQTITIPPNVNGVHILRQQNSLLRGHNIKITPKSNTQILSTHFDPARIHGEMDESPHFKNLIAEVMST